MKRSTLVSAARLVPLAWSHLRGEAADALFVGSGGTIDTTRPRRVYGLLNERCNLRCQGCPYWRMERYRTELTADEWIATLADLKAFLGPFHINFSGGEPLLRSDLPRILNFCRDHGIHAGLTTSGVLLRDRQAEELVEARLFNLCVSLDGVRAQTHDRQRGVPGVFDKAVRAIGLMRDHADKAGLSVPIIIKPTVSALNLGEMPALVSFAESLGCSVLFQPVSDWGTAETQALWIRDPAELQAIAGELIAMKAAGQAILNTAEQIRDWARHFAGEPVPMSAGSVRCSVGLDTLIIHADGELLNCYQWPALGNVRDGPIRDTWRGEASNHQRAEALGCTRGCTENCAVKRPVSQQVRGAIRLLRSS